ncbi:MAG: four helix bundle protein [Dehalococcoidia bacterium]|nr:four helix bundle protein [Dehalococcoidia bacterium]
MPARTFEDLLAWQRARDLTREIYGLTGTKPFRYDRSLVDQVRRAAVSVMSNIAEGFERQESVAEFGHFLNIAKGSCAELRSQLYVALDADYIAPDHFNRLKAQAEEVSRITAGLKSAVSRRKEATAR